MTTENISSPIFEPKDLDLRPDDRAYAEWLDGNDPLRHLRHEFWLPQKQTLKKSVNNPPNASNEPAVYLSGSGIGLQPRCMGQYVHEYLQRWATQGLFAGAPQVHVPDSGALSWAEVELEAARLMAKIVGAKPEETVLMAGLTISVHLLLASFYRPRDGNGKRRKIIIERHAFSSDLFAVESQVRWHGLDLAESIILVDSDPLIPASRVLEALDEHGESVALLVLSGVQYLTGQLLDIQTITEYAHRKGALVCWDLAHAVGNVELKLHEWEVDMAVWCCYKYLNSGPGTVGGTFIHEKHGQVDIALGSDGYQPRLAGWWGGRRTERFKMDNKFSPEPGAAGFQVSNVSILDLTAVLASMSVFEKTSISALREKSIKLTGYLEHLLKVSFPSHAVDDSGKAASPPFEIVTPASSAERGAQLSLKIKPELVDILMQELERNNVIVDIRRPSLMRITPVPLYNTFAEVYEFHSVFTRAVKQQVEESAKS